MTIVSTIHRTLARHDRAFERTEERAFHRSQIPVTINRAIPMKARKGQKYLFLDGCLKIRIKESDVDVYSGILEKFKEGGIFSPAFNMSWETMDKQFPSRGYVLCICSPEIRKHFNKGINDGEPICVEVIRTGNPLDPFKDLRVTSAAHFSGDVAPPHTYVDAGKWYFARPFNAGSISVGTQALDVVYAFEEKGYVVYYRKKYHPKERNNKKTNKRVVGWKRLTREKFSKGFPVGKIVHLTTRLYHGANVAESFAAMGRRMSRGGSLSNVFPITDTFAFFASRHKKSPYRHFACSTRVNDRRGTAKVHIIF